MRRVSSLALALVASVSVASVASAAVFVTTSPGPDPGPAAGETQIITFDDGSAPQGVEINGNGGIVQAGYTAPLGDTTPFLVTPLTGDSGSVELKFADFLGGRDVRSFSFYWGSIDRFNTVQLFDRSANQIVVLSGDTLLGALATGSSTDPSANRRVYFTLTGTSQNLGSLRLTSTAPAFEADTFSFAAVPEPGLWAMMIAGFGLLGAALRVRRRAAAKVLGSSFS